MRRDHRPFAGALLSCGIEDLVDERLAVGIFESENVAGNFDEVRVEFPFVPLGKHRLHLVGAKTQPGLQEVVGFADELHIAVLDPVVNHLNVMACAVFSHPIAAGRAVLDFCGDALENIFHVGPCGGRPAGHDTGAMASAFFATGNTGADVEQPFGLDVFHAARCVLEKGIATVNYDIAWFEVREEVLDKFINSLAGLDHQHDTAGFFQQSNHLLDGMGSDNFAAFSLIIQEIIHL